MSGATDILVLLPGPMGDAIMATPALRRIKEGLPTVRVTLLGSAVTAAILEHFPWADEVISHQQLGCVSGKPFRLAKALRKRKYDAVVLFPNSFRTAALARLACIPLRIGYARDARGWLLTHPVATVRLGGRFPPISMLEYYRHLADRAVQFLQPIACASSKSSVSGPAGHDYPLNLATGPADRSAVDDLLTRWGLDDAQRLVLFVPGGAFGGSKWWPADRFAQLAERLSEHDHCRIIVSGAPNQTERELTTRIKTAANCQVYDLAEQDLGLGLLKELIRRCALVVGNDTGPCHIAAAFNVPLVTIFGPTDPRWTAGSHPREIRLHADVDCSPCQQQICTQDHRCMTAITVDQVYAAAQHQLNSPSPEAPVDASLSGDLSAVPTLVGTLYSAFDEQFVFSASGTGLVHRQYQQLLDRAGLSTPADVFHYDQGQRLDKPGLIRRERFRLRLSDAQGDEAVIYLKRYGRPDLTQRIKRFLRRDRQPTAGYDFSAALLLAEQGILVPRPVALGWDGSGLTERRSFVMIEQLPHADALERLLADKPHTQTDYALLRDRHELIGQLAQLVRKLHQTGFYHRDLYLAHIFLARPSTGCEQLCLIDLQRVFRPRLCRHRWRVKDLAQLYYSARQFFSNTDALRFLRQYCASERLTAREKRLARAIVRKTRRIARHDRNRIRRYQEP